MSRSERERMRELQIIHPSIYRVLVPMSPVKIKSIYRYLLGNGVSMVDAIGLSLALADASYKEIAETAQVHRAQIHAMLSGARPVMDEVRKAFRQRLGFDPWKEAGVEGKPRERNLPRRGRTPRSSTGSGARG